MSIHRHVVRAALAGALAIGAGLGVLPSPAAGVEPAASQPFSARYELLRDGRVLGEAQLTLARGSDDTWRFETNTRGTRGLASVARAEINERSTFRWRGLIPELVEYDYRQSVAMRRRERSLRVDAASNSILSRQDDRSWELRFEEGVVDRHAVAIGIIAAVAAGRADLAFRVADRDDVESQRYRVAGRERVDVRAGSFDAVLIERIREKPGRDTDTWLAPELGYLAVRIRHREADGETLEMRLVSHDLGTATAAPPARR
jgi:hypothetical protein